MVTKRVHYLAKRHLLVVEWVNLVQKTFNLILILQNIHESKQFSKLDLADHTVLVAIYRLEQVREFYEETLMLLQLKVEDDFLEV